MNRTHGPTITRECLHPNVTHQHGTRGAYNADACRCVPCRNANTKALNRYRRRKVVESWTGATHGLDLVDPRGTVRRLQALAVEGWSGADVARHVGMTREEVNRTRRGVRVVLTRRNVERLRRTFEALGQLPQPTGQQADKTRRFAARHGWVSALAWDDIDQDDAPAEVAEPTRVRDIEVDIVVVDQIVAGSLHPSNATRAERLEAVAQLVRFGFSTRAISERIGTHPRAVDRDRADLGLTETTTDQEVTAA